MEQIISLIEPPLVIGEHTETLLRSIARGAMARAPEVAIRLLDEIDRADLVSETELPADVVTLGSFVTYQVVLTGSVNTIQLVPPHEADPGRLRVSVVSGVGAALIGLKVGQQIQWELGGRQHVLEVIRVSKNLKAQRT
jgi:regulator of nucleoside diphosphate kinase